MTDILDQIAETAHQEMEDYTKNRDSVLSKSRLLIRHCSQTIRAIHRDDKVKANEELFKAREIAESLNETMTDYPGLYFTGYTQDGLKEYAEASIFYSLVEDGTYPTPEDLNIISSTYLKGLSETVGEMRRRILDILRDGYSDEIERLLGYMGDIYDVLVTMDYPDAVTGGLRRLTDISRSIIEKTRGDITISLRQEKLEKQLHKLEEKLRKLDN
ncbi:MAG: haloacid dehalogenase [Anaerolineales bacterium]|nr:haloacid dehalogenase [Anaerolineales bacterium]